MAMKLLSVKATKDSLQQEQALKVIRTQEVEELAKKSNAKLARAEADFNDALAKNRKQWAEELEEKQMVMIQMEKEVEVLEERKCQALIPISLYKEEADKIMLEAKETLDRVRDKETQADGLLEKLEDKLTMVADREQLVTKEEQRQEISLAGIKLQQEQTKTGIDNLSQEMLAFNQKKELEEANILERKKELALAEISFKAKTDKYKRDVEALKQWELQLADERETLKRAFDRIK